MKHRSALIYCAFFFLVSVSGQSFAQTVTTGNEDTSFYCPQLSVLLQRGARDNTTQGQVSELQSFLVDRYALDEQVMITGFFGKTTQMYVQQFQREEGLPALGIVGAMTRARIAAVCAQIDPRKACTTPESVRCNQDEEFVPGAKDAMGCTMVGWCRQKSSSSDFYRKPEEGYAPLSVAFYAMVGGSAQYAVDFGDGTSPQTIACVAPVNACVAPGKVEHVYSKAGNYTATLRRIYRMMELQPGDRILGPLASLPITVKEKEIPVVKPDARCKVWFDGCNTCTRTVSGGAFACTQMVCTQNSVQPVCREYFALGKTDAPPSITTFSGPTQLEVNQDGMWRIEARDPEAQQLSYRIDWGEHLQGQSTTSVPTNFSQTAFASHRFSQAGSYTIGVTVYDTAGGSATSSAIVTVGNATAACPSQAQVCGERRVCTSTECWNEKRTYDTICALRAESAVLISEGACSF